MLGWLRRAFSRPESKPSPEPVPAADFGPVLAHQARIVRQRQAAQLPATEPMLRAIRERKAVGRQHGAAVEESDDLEACESGLRRCDL